MILIKEYQVYADNKKDHKHLEAYEQLWINKIKCVNQKNPFRIKMMSAKKYREENKEKLRAAWKEHYENTKQKQQERKRQYYEANKSKLNARCKEYTSKNSEKVKKYQKEWYERKKEERGKVFACECGCEVRRADIPRHRRTMKHIKNIFLLLPQI
jgi:hypothetical protein